MSQVLSAIADADATRARLHVATRKSPFLLLCRMGQGFRHRRHKPINVLRDQLNQMHAETRTVNNPEEKQMHLQDIQAVYHLDALHEAAVAEKKVIQYFLPKV